MFLQDVSVDDSPQIPVIIIYELPWEKYWSVLLLPSPWLGISACHD